MAYELLKNLNDRLNEKDVIEEKDQSVPAVARSSARAVYHRDYLRTKNKKYRKEQRKHK